MNPTTVCVVTISLLHAFVSFTPSYAALTNTTVTPVVHPESRVVGGTDAMEGQFPYQVRLTIYTSEGNSVCGGTVLTPRYVLTAAHCVVGIVNDIQVRAGFLDINNGGGVTVMVRSYHIHALYKYGSQFNNDIALLEMLQDLPIDGIRIATIPIRDNEVRSGTCCIVSGWGTLVEGGEGSNRLQYVALPIVDRTRCSGIFPYNIFLGQICAGYMSGGKDSCQGDSGGPLVCDGLLTGVVSWGLGCANKDSPGVYTNIHFYEDWLRSLMGTDLILQTPSNETIQSQVIPHCSPDSAHYVTSLSYMILLLPAITAFLY